MNIQSTLTLVIEVVFWAFMSLMIFDFTNRLFILDANTITAISLTPDNILPPTSVAIPVIAPEFEQLPDPWKLDVETGVKICSS